MRVILFIVFFQIYYLASSQQIKVSYIQKRSPAKTIKETPSVPLRVELSDIALPENDPDSLYVDVRRKVDSIRKLIKESKQYDWDQEKIPEYEYTTILRVDGELSIYYPQEEISNDTLTKQITISRGRNLSNKIINYNDSEIIYMDLQRQKKISSLKSHIFDLEERYFLIEEKITKFDWELLGEQKEIDGYVCNKAILSNEDDVVEVWYTKEISASNGPRGYWGLPGLILEVKEEDKHIKLEKISFFPDTFVITPPTKGEKITRQDFIDLPSKLFFQD